MWRTRPMTECSSSRRRPKSCVSWTQRRRRISVSVLFLLFISFDVTAASPAALGFASWNQRWKLSTHPHISDISPFAVLLCFSSISPITERQRTVVWRVKTWMRVTGSEASPLLLWSDISGPLRLRAAPPPRLHHAKCLHANTEACAHEPVPLRCVWTCHSTQQRWAGGTRPWCQCLHHLTLLGNPPPSDEPVGLLQGEVKTDP